MSDIDQDLVDLLGIMVKFNKILRKRVKNLENTVEKQQIIVGMLCTDLSKVKGEIQTLTRMIMNIPGESE